MITREEFENSYIINDHGELRDKYLKFATRNGKGFSTNFSRHFPIILVGSDSKVQHWTDLKKFFSSNWIDKHQPKQLTLADFEEEEQKEKEEMETPVIDWSKAPEGYDYWIEYKGTHIVPSDFHKLGFKEDVEVYLDTNGKFFYKDDENIIVHKQPEKLGIKLGDKVLVEKGNFSISEQGERYIREVCKVVSLFSTTNPFDGEVEMSAVSLPDGSCCCFRKEMLRPYKKTWQDEVSQYVIKEGITYSCNGAKHIKALSDYSDEQFLEMCRITLRAVGELE